MCWAEGTASVMALSKPVRCPLEARVAGGRSRRCGSEGTAATSKDLAFYVEGGPAGQLGAEA